MADAGCCKRITVEQSIDSSATAALALGPGSALTDSLVYPMQISITVYKRLLTRWPGAIYLTTSLAPRHVKPSLQDGA